MKKNLLLSFIFLTIVWACGNQQEATSTSVTKYVGGIQINEADQVEWAKTLKAAGMNLAQVTAYARQGNWDTDDLWWHYEDTTHVIHEIQSIRSQGVEVIMVIRVALQHSHLFLHNDFKWHGMIYPMTRQQAKVWFEKYQTFLEMWAKICEREGVKFLVIGSELNALSATVPIKEMPPLLEFFSNEKKHRKHEYRVLKYKKQLKEENLWVRGRANFSNEKKYIETKIQEKKNWAKQVSYANYENNIQWSTL